MGHGAAVGAHRAVNPSLLVVLSGSLTPILAALQERDRVAAAGEQATRARMKVSGQPFRWWVIFENDFVGFDPSQCQLFTYLQNTVGPCRTIQYIMLPKLDLRPTLLISSPSRPRPCLCPTQAAELADKEATHGALLRKCKPKLMSLLHNPGRGAAW